MVLRFGQYKFYLLVVTIVSLVFLNFFSRDSNIALAAAMTSTNYNIDKDSLNAGGGESNSSSYSLEDTSGEVGTGKLTSSNFQNLAGYQQTATSSDDDDDDDSGTPDESSGQSNSGGSAGIQNISDLSVVGGTQSIILNWQNPTNSFDSIVVVRSIVFYPNNVDDGQIVFSGVAESFLDTDVVPGIVYYYTIFTKLGNRYSSGVIGGGVSLITQPEVGDALSGDVFADIVELPRNVVDARFENFSLIDLDLFQGDKKIDFISNIAKINGGQNTKFSIDYEKLPEILKTIVVTMYDPEDSSKSFSFLLRLNEQKTAYEATVGPFDRDGEYRFGLAILDFRNLGLKKITGTILVDVTENGNFWKELLGLRSEKSFVFYLFLILLVILVTRFFLKSRS